MRDQRPGRAGAYLLAPLALEVTAKPGAAQDAEGKLAFTAWLDNGPTVTCQSTVTIGEGVDLAGVIAKPFTVAPGASTAIDLRVSNAGTRPIKGAVLVMTGWEPSLTTGGGFSNCTYGLLAICTFDDELATSTGYEVSTPLRLRIPADAAAGSRASMIGSWYTPSDFKELLDIGLDLDDELIGPKGTGDPAELRAIPARQSSRVAAVQVDTDPLNNIAISEFVVGNRHPDMAAIGASVSGQPGEKVRAKVGFVNNGPGTLYHFTFDNTDTVTHVVVPAVLRVTEVDHGCFPRDSDDDAEFEDMDENRAGAAEYVCLTKRETTPATSSNLFDFTFEVRENASAAAGQVLINEALFAEEDTTVDRDARNEGLLLARRRRVRFAA